MKKHFALILSTCALVSCFICFWYKDELFNYLFVLGIYPFGISVLILLASLVVAIVSAVRHHFTMKSCLALAISVLTIVLLLVFPFRMAKVRLELQLHEKDRLQIVDMVKNGELAVDDLGNARLPKGYGRLSTDGNIFIYQNNAEQVVSFWVFRGMLSGSVELIYSSTDEALIFENETGHPITNIIKLKEHWYLVDTDY